MLFRRRKLRKEYNNKLVYQLEQLQTEWANKRALVEKGFDVSAEFIAESKLAEAKYFFLFKEAKERKISFKAK